MQFDQLRRREVLALLGAAVTWPLAARAQQPTVRVIGSRSSILHGAPEKVSMKPFSRMPDATTPAVAY
jgi:hypothetical protein